MEIPFVNKNEYSLIDIANDGFVTLFLENGETKENLKLPEDDPELSNKIKIDFEAGKDLLVTITTNMG